MAPPKDWLKDPAKREAHAAKLRQRWAERKARDLESSSVSDSGDTNNHGGGGDRDDDGGGGGDNDNRSESKSDRGSYAGKRHSTSKAPVSTDPAIKAQKYKKFFPWLLKKANKATNIFAQMLSWIFGKKIIITVEELTTEEAQADGEMLSEFAEDYVPEWFKRHPILGAFFILGMNTIGKIKMAFRTDVLPPTQGRPGNGG